MNTHDLIVHTYRTDSAPPHLSRPAHLLLRPVDGDGGALRVAGPALVALGTWTHLGRFFVVGLMQGEHRQQLSRLLQGARHCQGAGIEVLYRRRVRASPPGASAAYSRSTSFSRCPNSTWAHSDSDMDGCAYIRDLCLCALSEIAGPTQRRAPKTQAAPGRLAARGPAARCLTGGAPHPRGSGQSPPWRRR